MYDEEVEETVSKTEAFEKQPEQVSKEFILPSYEAFCLADNTGQPFYCYILSVMIFRAP